MGGELQTPSCSKRDPFRLNNIRYSDSEVGPVADVSHYLIFQVSWDYDEILEIRDEIFHLAHHGIDGVWSLGEREAEGECSLILALVGEFVASIFPLPDCALLDHLI